MWSDTESLPSRAYANRLAAGRTLAGALRQYATRDDVVVLGLPRGGMPVAAVVAHALAAPLDVFVVRTLGVRQHRERALGAIASGGIQVMNADVVERLDLSLAEIDAIVQREGEELRRRERRYRNGRSPLPLAGQVVILVDDGLATGASMRAAVRAVKELARRVIVAVPVGAKSTCEDLQEEADRVICSLTPEPLDAVSLFYQEFQPTTDEEVKALMRGGSGS
jgi:predicted phosphoribosyltransferase